MKTQPETFATVPMQWVGPMRLNGKLVSGELSAPLATYESPLWPSTNRGARVSMACDGIHVSVAQDLMARSILLEAPSAAAAVEATNAIVSRKGELAAVVGTTTNHGEFSDLHWQLVGNLIFLRIEMQTGDASGHNMVTGAADAVMTWLLEQYPALTHVSVSGNYCTDKKPSAVNGILGRGKYVVAEMVIPQQLCQKLLRASPESIASLNTKKNLIGTSLAGGVRSANAHFANMLLGFYLATGQDAANIIEGSQGYTYADVRDEALHFSVTLPNVIVGSVGNGKDLPFVEENLARLGCREDRPTGDNGRRLAAIAGAVVLCGELSLLAAQTNPGELMKAHRKLERNHHE
ncbi:MAG: hydroxymethylglutaryl-CoA reductase [Verrucomicrobia bacterium]|jgi:hydroxymethylglutaryl-CoA reductase (NADPH)|nr:hydroxymethylglutaryl-CoA reductase [Verrucomicrobiota bacterium]